MYWSEEFAKEEGKLEIVLKSAEETIIENSQPIIEMEQKDKSISDLIERRDTFQKDVLETEKNYIAGIEEKTEIIRSLRLQLREAKREKSVIQNDYSVECQTEGTNLESTAVQTTDDSAEVDVFKLIS